MARPWNTWRPSCPKFIPSFPPILSEFVLFSPFLFLVIWFYFIILLFIIQTLFAYRLDTRSLASLFALMAKKTEMAHSGAILWQQLFNFNLDWCKNWAKDGYTFHCMVETDGESCTLFFCKNKRKSKNYFMLFYLLFIFIIITTTITIITYL